MDKRRILVIEDEYSINDGLTFTLRKEGYDVRSALTGKEGLELVKEFNPELVLLDLMLPDMEGFDILFGPSVSSSYSTQIINGKSTSQSSFSHTYILTAPQEGSCYTSLQSSCRCRHRVRYHMLVDNNKPNRRFPLPSPRGSLLCR